MSTRRNRWRTLGWLAVMLSGCATPNYQAVHRATLEAGPRPAQIGDIPFDPSHDSVRIIDDYASAGFSFDPTTSQLSVLPGHAHEIVGWVHLTFPLLENPARSLWFIKYRPEQRWRKGYCYWQVPLTWVTLGAWYLVPLYYVCPVAPWHVGAMREVAGKGKRIEILEKGLKAEATRKGGNAVIGAKIFDQGATGWIVRLSDAPASPPVAPAEASPAVDPDAPPADPSWNEAPSDDADHGASSKR